MSHYQSSAALQIQQEVHPASIGMLFKVFEQSEDQLKVARLNLKLQQQFGEDHYLQCYSGEQLFRLPQSTLNSLADCYAEVFNESWGEDWTRESALEEIQSCIECDPNYTPVMSILFREDDVIGFCWGFIMDAESLTDDSAPFSSSDLKRHESVNVARYWLDQVGRKSRFISIRELGVLREYRQDKTPYLTLPIFEKAKAAECCVAFFRTKISSKAFKWSLGVGFVPLQLFMVDGLLLMKGSVKYAMELLYGSIDQIKKRKSQVEIIGNIKRYLCD
jgi:hypothetical protein